jgi:hypothetical protein
MSTPLLKVLVPNRGFTWLPNGRATGPLTGHGSRPRFLPKSPRRESRTRAAAAGEAPPLQLPDQPLDALARPLQLLGRLLVRLRVGADLLEEGPPLDPDLVERDPLAVGLGLETVQLPLPRLETRLRVLHLSAARLREENLAAVLLRDACEIVGACHEVAEGACGEEIFEIGATAALVDLA